MNEQSYATAPGLIGMQADNKPTELERLASILIDQKHLLDTLQSRLRVVSHPMPSNETMAAAQSTTPHISSLIDVIADNNSRIRQMITELAV